MGAPLDPTIDLVVPARNEAVNIPSLLESIPWSMLRHVVVVDNGSTDQTAWTARQGGAIVIQEKRRGYGSACLAGLAWIADCDEPPDLVGFVDADLADDPRHLVDLSRPITNGTADLVIACRQLHAEKGALTATQRFGNRLACLLIWMATGRRYRDIGPMRMVRYTSLKTLAMSDLTWGWTVEMQFKAAVTGLRFSEIDLPYHQRHAGKSKISGSVIGSIRAGVKIITTIGKLWWQHPTARSKQKG